MTMFPATLQSSSTYVNGGFSEGGGGYDCFIRLGGGVFSDLMADQDESRTETSTNNNEEEEAGSSSKDINIINDNNPEDDHGRWLQLSLGGGHMQSDRHQITSAAPPSSSTSSVDLDLLPGQLNLLQQGGSDRSSSQQVRLPVPPPQLVFQVPEFRGHHLPTSTTFFLQPHPPLAAMNSVPAALTLQHQQQLQETNYNYLQLIRPFPGVSSSSSFSGSAEGGGRQLHVHRRLNVARVVNPPRRPHSGVWFMLQASQNQAKEPFLPQIPKSYLRIKDGKMTVGLLIKYLANKLELGSESEVEITCKGHRLLSLSTLQYVRDTIWNNPRNDVGFTLVPQSSATTSHFMVLNYGRIA